MEARVVAGTSWRIARVVHYFARGRLPVFKNLARRWVQPMQGHFDVEASRVAFRGDEVRLRLTFRASYPVEIAELAVQVRHRTVGCSRTTLRELKFPRVPHVLDLVLPVGPATWWDLKPAPRGSLVPVRVDIQARRVWPWLEDFDVSHEEVKATRDRLSDDDA